jgi:hypothetical protein
VAIALVRDRSIIELLRLTTGREEMRESGTLELERRILLLSLSISPAKRSV